MAFFAKLGFVLYVSYIVKAFALHDVFYSLYLYTESYHFLFMGLFSIGFFLFPLLLYLNNRFNYKDILLWCFCIQSISLLLFVLSDGFWGLMVSALAMSLVNIILVISVVLIVNISPSRDRVWALALTDAFSFAYVLVIYKQLYYLAPEYQRNLLYISMAAILIALLFAMSLKPQVNKNSHKNLSDVIFLGIFSVMKKGWIFLGYVLLVSALSSIYMTLDAFKLQGVYRTGDYHLLNIFALILSVVLIFSISKWLSSRQFVVMSTLCSLTYFSLSFYFLTANQDYMSFSIAIIFFDKILNCSVVSLWVGYIMKSFLEVFKRTQLFSFTLFYLLCAIIIWWVARIIGF